MFSTHAGEQLKGLFDALLNRLAHLLHIGTVHQGGAGGHAHGAQLPCGQLRIGGVCHQATMTQVEREREHARPPKKERKRRERSGGQHDDPRP